jgi:hypothetical protein
VKQIRRHGRPLAADERRGCEAVRQAIYRHHGVRRRSVDASRKNR